MVAEIENELIAKSGAKFLRRGYTSPPRMGRTLTAMTAVGAPLLLPPLCGVQIQIVLLLDLGESYIWTAGQDYLDTAFKFISISILQCYHLHVGCLAKQTSRKHRVYSPQVLMQVSI